MTMNSWTSLSSATTGNFTSSFEMEMSQAGFSAHASKVSLNPIIYLRGIHKYHICKSIYRKITEPDGAERVVSYL